MGDPLFKVSLDLDGDWRTAVRALQRTQATMSRVQSQAIRQEAQVFRTAVVKGIREQSPAGQKFKTLSPYTIAMRTFMRRRSSKALIERGDLLQSIKLHSIDPNTVFVGVRRGAVNSEGRQLVNIAELNEFGTKRPILIKITPKMAHFLAMAFRKLNIPRSAGRGDGYLHITIPARPSFGPVFDKLGPRVRERVMERMVKLLRGVIGKDPTPIGGG